MATITKRKRADGSIAYRATVRIKERGTIVHQESATRDSQREAKAWAAEREVELRRPGAIARIRAAPTVGDMINWYLRKYGEGFGRSKLTTLKAMAEYGIAKERAAGLTARRIITHIEERREEGAGPATAGNDIIWLRVVAKAARPGMGLDVDMQAIEDAAAFCRDQRLIGKAKKRSRRPTAQELETLRRYFNRGDGRLRMPMADIMDFAIDSTRRLEEITLLQWADNNEEHHTGMVRDLKHPTEKKGNHKEFKYTPGAWEIVQRQPKRDGEPYIFPFNHRSISAMFHRACLVNGIEDLRFHDLRHEGVSRLFELGYSIQEVMHFSLHESWATLQRYTHTKAKDVEHR